MATVIRNRHNAN